MTRKSSPKSDTVVADFEHPSLKRVYREVSYRSLIVDPKDNYRWGSAEMRDKDLKSVAATDDTEFVGYEAIKSSIAAAGMHEPLWAIKDGDKFRVFAGFTRGHAAIELRLESVPIFVYAELNDTEREMLQLRENSDRLKRYPNWGLETTARKKQHEALEAKYTTGQAKLRKDHRGDELSASMSAYHEMAEALGCYYTTLRDHVTIFKALHPKVQQWARDGHIGYKSAQEFTNRADPYTPEFIEQVMLEIRRCNPAGKVTPREVQTAKLRVKKWLEEGRAAGKTMWRATTKGTDEEKVAWAAADVPRLSPGAVRDMAMNFAAVGIASLRLTVDSTDDEWEKVRTHGMWFRVAGMGFGTGDILRPADGESADGCDLGDMRTREFSYVAGVLAHTAIRKAVNEKIGRRYTFSRWLAARTRIDFRIALRSAVQDAVVRDTTNKVGAIVRAAWADLIVRIPPMDSKGGNAWTAAIRDTEARATQEVG